MCINACKYVLCNISIKYRQNSKAVSIKIRLNHLVAFIDLQNPSNIGQSKKEDSYHIL